MGTIRAWHIRLERLRCGRRGHLWVPRVAYGPGELHDFAVCTRCGHVDDKPHGANQTI
jgi:hypothetical protein